MNSDFVMDEIKNRYSVRKYKSTKVEEEKLSAILEAVRLAPSARNYQNWHFVVIKDKDRRKRLAEICKDQKFVAEAPVTIAICMTNLDYVMSGGTPAYIVDGAIAGEHIALQAVKLGLGTCWIGAFSHEPLEEFLNLPKDFRVVCLLTLGYPANSKKERSLKELSKIVHYEKF